MKNVIPTVGRTVWFTPDNNDALVITDNVQPCAAIVAYVHGPRLVNLTVFDHGGTAHAKVDVPFVQEDDAERPHGYYCEWMPFVKPTSKDAEFDAWIDSLEFCNELTVEQLMLMNHAWKARAAGQRKNPSYVRETP